MDIHRAPVTLGRLLRHHRQRMGVNQVELARRAELSVRALRDIEQGRVARPRESSVRRLAEVLELSDADRDSLLAAADGHPARSGAVRLRIDVLGPLAVRRLGRPIDLASRMQRDLLGLLALQAGQVVSGDEIVDVLWGERPPRSSLRLVYGYVGQIRGLLEPQRAQRVPARVLRRVPGGYLLELAEGQLDLTEFDEQAAAGQRARAAGDAAGALRFLGWAVDVWRGPALADAGAGLRHHPAVVAVAGRRITTALAYADVAVDLGQHTCAAERLRVLAGDEPLHEGLAARLMIALAGAGQQAAALRLFTELRWRLRDELGVEPGPELQDAHLRVLRGEVPPVALVSTTARPARPEPAESEPAGSLPAGSAPPAQLPADVAAFTGRADYLKQLDSLLPGEGAGPAPAVVISAIAGTAGVGKTALAIHWAHRVREAFPDGQLYVNLRGFDPGGGPPVSPGAAIGGFLEALEVPPHRIPDGLDAQVGMYRSRLAGRRVLVVLDNARDVEQVRPLLPGSPGCLAIVTSRNQLTGLIAAEGAYPLTLDLLTAEEAGQLLARRLGPDRVAAEPDAVDEIIARCARLPLALAVAAARAATHPHFPLAAVASELSAAPGSLDAFDGGDPLTNARAVFSWSYRTLGEGAARLFRLLGQHPGPDVTAPALASLAGVGADQVRPLLVELLRAHLVAEHVPGRYSHHDLLRAYATELAGTLDSDADRRAATDRLLDHYLRSAENGAQLVKPLRDAEALPAAVPGISPERFTDHLHALAWFAAEHDVLLSVIHHAAALGRDRQVCALTWATTDYLQRRGHWRDTGTIMCVALAAARRLDDPAAQAHALGGLGVSTSWAGRYADARLDLCRALELYERIGDRAGQARTRRGLAWSYEHEGRFAEAFDEDRRALELYRGLGDVGGQAAVLNAMGWYHAQLGDHQAALAHCHEALTLFLEIGNRNGQAHTWDSIGFAHHHLGHHDEAAACYQHALELFREIGNRYNEADTLAHLGDVRLAAEDPAAARHAWKQALAILDELRHSDAGTVQDKLDRLGGRRHR